jgi:hypothetical protein
VIPTNDVLETSFQLLSSTVRDFYSSGRPALGATLKPELYRRSAFQFSELQLGFPRFGDFLKQPQQRDTFNCLRRLAAISLLGLAE